MNISNAINIACKTLKKKFINSAQLDSELLMSKVLDKDRKYRFFKRSCSPTK